jgi:hypothetical protein
MRERISRIAAETSALEGLRRGTALLTVPPPCFGAGDALTGAVGGSGPDAAGLTLCAGGVVGSPSSDAGEGASVRAGVTGARDGDADAAVAGTLAGRPAAGAASLGLASFAGARAAAAIPPAARVDATRKARSNG